MKKVKVFNLITGESVLKPIDEVFFSYLKTEINNCKSTIKDYPDIGTVKDGSRFAMQTILESIEKKANIITDKNMIFTSFYQDIIDDICAINEIINNVENVPTKCILIGQRQGYSYVKGLIERLNKEVERLDKEKFKPMLMQLTEPEYMCPECGYKFYVYNKENRPNECGYCNVSFKWDE